MKTTGPNFNFFYVWKATLLQNNKTNLFTGLEKESNCFGSCGQRRRQQLVTHMKVIIAIYFISRLIAIAIALINFLLICLPRQFIGTNLIYLGFNDMIKYRIS